MADQNTSQDLIQKLKAIARAVNTMNVHRIVFSIFSVDKFIFFSEYNVIYTNLNPFQAVKQKWNFGVMKWRGIV
ncbi:MAG: hypothetical protein ACOCG6_02010 [Candidatus Cloacimonadaceae bacterium]